VLVSILIGPYLRKFGAYTVPGLPVLPLRRQLRPLPRRGRAGVLLLHLRDGADLRAPASSPRASSACSSRSRCSAGLVGILLCRCWAACAAVTWTQIAQYIVLIIAYLTPIVILSTKKYGIRFPN